MSIPDPSPKRESSHGLHETSLPSINSSLGAPLLIQENRMKHLAQSVLDDRHHTKDK